MTDRTWTRICTIDDLVPGSGVAALVDGEQVALFHLPAERPDVYAIDNRDPVGGANVMSRGIVGDIDGELVVASPLYKQHFSLTSGRCLEQEGIAVRVWPVELRDGEVWVKKPRALRRIESAA